MQVYNRPDLSKILVGGSALALLSIAGLCGLGYGWREYGWLRSAPRLGDVPIYPQARNLVQQADSLTLETDSTADEVGTFYGNWLDRNGWVLDGSWHGAGSTDAGGSYYVWPSEAYVEERLSLTISPQETDPNYRVPTHITIQLDPQTAYGAWPTSTSDPNQPTSVPQPPLPTPIPTAVPGR